MRIVVINMDKDVDRWKSMRAHLDDVGARGEDVRRFSAVDGRKIPSSSKNVTLACRAFCTPTMKGCALSHMALWKTGLERGDDAMLVLEDDARLAPDWATVLDLAMAQVPRENWDMIQLGTIAPSSIVVGKRVGPNVVRPRVLAGTHAYVISRRGMRHYVRAIERAAYHIDIHMGFARRRDGVFLTDPQVATQADMGSNSMQFVDGAIAWPSALNAVLATVPVGGAPLNYWMTVPIAQIGGIAINGWTIIFAILGAVARRRPELAFGVVALVGLQPVRGYSGEMALCIVLFFLLKEMAPR